MSLAACGRVERVYCFDPRWLFPAPQLADARKLGPTTARVAFLTAQSLQSFKLSLLVQVLQHGSIIAKQLVDGVRESGTASSDVSPAISAGSFKQKPSRTSNPC